MNTKVCAILEALPNSFRLAKGILKDKKGVHMRVKSSLAFSTKKKNNNTK